MGAYLLPLHGFMEGGGKKRQKNMKEEIVLLGIIMDVAITR